MYIFIDYAQLVSFMPLLCARYNPQLYEVFKSFLWANLCLERPNYYYDVSSNYYSDHAQFYGLSNGQLFSSTLIWGGILLLLLIVNCIVNLLHRN